MKMRKEGRRVNGYLHLLSFSRSELPLHVMCVPFSKSEKS
jgi:hypothetical protein